MDPKIVKVEFIPEHCAPTKVMATFDDGTVGEVFTFFSDELSFTEAELIGKTASEASDYKVEKDKKYLQS